jgi:putative DNA primase/helicase
MGGADSERGTIPYVPYDPESAEQKALTEFFAKIYPDKTLREYILTLYASCLEGTNKEQKFHVNTGKGSNGKSMVEILMEQTFGDYGTSISTATFTRKRPDGGAANPDIITVQKRRYIHCGEPDDDEKINTSIMKQWSGGDRIAARGLFAEQEKFSIMGKIFMSTNELPPISKTDNGTWRRMRVNPHVSMFKDPGDADIDPSKHIYEKDYHLESKLKHWRTAFLSLLVHYYNEKYLKYGLREPECVLSASNKYKEISDQFTNFFNAFFVRDPTAGPVRRKEIADKFTQYKRELGGRECELKQSVMFDRMKEMCGSSTNDREYWGIRLLSDDDDGASYTSNNTKKSGGAVGGAGLQLVADDMP